MLGSDKDKAVGSSDLLRRLLEGRWRVTLGHSLHIRSSIGKFDRLGLNQFHVPAPAAHSNTNCASRMPDRNDKTRG